jgi:hypothetical protein
MNTKYALDIDSSPLMVRKVGQGEYSTLRKIGICFQLLAIFEVIYYTKDLPIGGSIFTVGVAKLATILA